MTVRGGLVNVYIGAATNHAARCGARGCVSPPNPAALQRLLSLDKPRVLPLKLRTTCHGPAGLVPAIARMATCRQRLGREVVVDDHSGNLQSREHNMNHFNGLIVDSHTTSGVVVHVHFGAATNHAARCGARDCASSTNHTATNPTACHRSSGRFGGGIIGNLDEYLVQGSSRLLPTQSARCRWTLWSRMLHPCRIMCLKRLAFLTAVFSWHYDSAT